MSISKTIPYCTKANIKPPQTIGDYYEAKKEAREMIQFLEEHHPSEVERYEQKLDYLQYLTDAIIIIDAIAGEVNSEMWEKRK